jgi:hypothetical protein
VVLSGRKDHRLLVFADNFLAEWDLKRVHEMHHTDYL